jgi:hypothetical protein
MSTSSGHISAYEEVLYPGGIFPQTHPDRLATIGTLRGMCPASIDCCRILELACSSGNNLIAMAANLPGSELVGVDLAKNAIAAGQAVIAGLEFGNIHLHHLYVFDLSRARFGQFDYIIAHGLYSWVPASVREHILVVCSEMLNSQGIAYISYNAQPGNHLRDLSRAIMRYHVAHFEDPKEKIRQGRGILKFLSECRVNANPYATALKAEFERVVNYTDEVFFHDDLSAINQAFYFREFLSAAQQHSLQFLGEASPNEIGPRNFTPDVIPKLKELEGGSEIIREQYKDFILGRAFRETLLCHEELQLAADFLPERILELHAACDAAVIDSEESDHSVLFRKQKDSEVQISHPRIAAALKYLCAQWPCAASFGALLEVAQSERAVSEGHAAFEVDNLFIAEALTALYKAGFVELHVIPPRLVNSVSERPTSSRLPRFQLARGASTSNQLHQPLKFPDAESRHLVLLLDGSRDKEMIVREFTDFVKSTRSEITGGASIGDIDEIAAGARRNVEVGLETLARGAMLIA